MIDDAPLVRVRDVVKQYQALRPLRISALTVGPHDIVTIMGLDAGAAEMLVGLLTGAMLPDSGEVRLFGQPTSAVADSEAWLAMLDGVGIVTDRAVLIAQFSVEQNIAMPFTLEIDPVTPDVRARVADLAQEVGLDSSTLTTRVADAGLEVQSRVRLARALALTPRLVIAEHPSATLPPASVKGFAEDVRRAARVRGLGVLAITEDPSFARALGGQVLALEPATGMLRPRSLWQTVFGR